MRRPSAPSPPSAVEDRLDLRALRRLGQPLRAARRERRVGDARRAEREAEERAHGRELPGDRRRRQPVPGAAELGRVLDEHADVDLARRRSRGARASPRSRAGRRRTRAASTRRERARRGSGRSRSRSPPWAFSLESGRVLCTRDRRRSPLDRQTRTLARVVCVNGGTAAEVPGTWSASVEWLVRRLAAGHPALAFLEVRYRVKSWRQLESCVEDARAAIAVAPRGGCGRGRAARLLDGRRGLGARRRRSRGLDRDRARAVALPRARRLAARRPPLRRPARLARPRPARAPGCPPRALAARLRAGARARRRRRAHGDRRRDPPDRACAPRGAGWCRCRGPAAGRSSSAEELERFCA